MIRLSDCAYHLCTAQTRYIWVLLPLYHLHLLTFPALYSLFFSFSLYALPPSLLRAHPLLLILLCAPLPGSCSCISIPYPSSYHSPAAPPPFLLPLCSPFSYLTSLFLHTLNYTPSSSTSLPSIPITSNSMLLLPHPLFYIISLYSFFLYTPASCFCPASPSLFFSPSAPMYLPTSLFCTTTLLWSSLSLPNSLPSTVICFRPNISVRALSYL
jgi:hypothetical protein